MDAVTVTIIPVPLAVAKDLHLSQPKQASHQCNVKVWTPTYLLGGHPLACPPPSGVRGLIIFLPWPK